MQQEASRKLGYGPKRTMSVAQRLYEGIEIDGEPTGLITYMRTDSVNLAKSAQAEAHEVISGRYGREYAVEGGRGYKTRAKGAQEAHEAIRPTSLQRAIPIRCAAASRTTSCASTGSSGSGRWPRRWPRSRWRRPPPSSRPVASGSAPAPRAPPSTASPRSTPRAATTARRRSRRRRLPALAEGDRSAVRDVEGEQHFTEPPPRYTEASLIKALEENGIGRPSTYAATISTIQDRGYVKVVDKRLRPEIVANIVTDVLVEHFGDYVDYDFTARMEEELDEVAAGKREWVPLLHEFYDPLIKLVDEKRKTLTRKELTTEETDEVCSEGPPHGHPPGAQRPLPGLLHVPRPQGDARHPRRGAGYARRSRVPASRAPSAARARSSPSAAATASSPAATAIPTATTSTAPARRRRRRCPSRWSAPSAARASSPPGGPGAPATSSTAVVAIPSATSPPTSSRSARSTTPTPARWRSRTRAASACAAVRSVELPGDRAELPGQKLPGGEPNPAALAPSRKRRAAAKAARSRPSRGTRKRKTTKSTTSAEPTTPAADGRRGRTGHDDEPGERPRRSLGRERLHGLARRA